MKTRLFLDLTARAPRPSIHFCDSREIEEITEELRGENIAVFEIDGAVLSSIESLFKAFAVALKKPKGWYGEEEYASNANAFLEYLDDVAEWVPAKGHIVVIRSSEQLWNAKARLAGQLTEWWQFANVTRQADIHLVFVW